MKSNFHHIGEATELQTASVHPGHRHDYGELCYSWVNKNWTVGVTGENFIDVLCEWAWHNNNSFVVNRKKCNQQPRSDIALQKKEG